MKLRRITETDTITKGDVLYDKHPNFSGVTKVTVTKVTKNLIITEHARYEKDGNLVDDRYMRPRLYKAVTD